MTILVIEDDRESLDSIVNTLEQEGFEVQTADDGYGGLDWARNCVPELIICNVMIPGLDGFSLLKEIREDDSTAAIPLIFITENFTHEAIREGMNLGADDYLPKPFTESDLLGTIQSRLKKQAAIAKTYNTTLNLLRKNIVYALPHELRTPLMAILGYSDLLMSDNETVKPQSIYEWAQHINLAGQRLHRVTENYLIYAQIALSEADDEQMQSLRNHILPYPAAIIENQTYLTAQKYRREMDVTVDLVNHALNVSEENLRKIVEELLDNAFKFSEPGSKVLVKTVVEHRTFSLYIRDYGRGMTAEHIKTMDAYMQFERVVYEQQGLGLGFVIAKRLVEIHKGRVEIKSALNKGTLVSIQFDF